MLGSLLAAAEAIASGGTNVAADAATVGGVLSGLSSKDPKDPARIAAANSALQKALAGDSSQILYMQQQAGLIPGYGSATAVGKEAFRRVLAAYDSAKGTHYGSVGTTGAAATPAPSPALSVVQQTTANVQKDVASGVQQLLTGGVNAVTGAISPNAGTSVPLTQNQIYLLGGLVALGLYFILRKK